MTYQYLTVEMVKIGKENGGFIDQKTLKRLESTDLTLSFYQIRACKYSTDTLLS